MGNSIDFKPLKYFLSEQPRNGLYKSKEFQGKGHRWIKMNELFSLSFLSKDVKTELLTVTNSEIERFSCQKGDLLFGRTSLTLDGVGDCLLVLDVHDQPIFESNLFRLRFDANKAYPLFFFYLFKSSHGRKIIQRIAKQTAATSITASDLIEEDVPHLSLTQQKIIADILYQFDQKKQSNYQINQTLEQMAQTLFKSWFVDFDPVIDNALDAGNEIPEPLQARAELRQKVRASQDFQPLPADVRALFPAEFEESELGCVPKGWQCKDMTQLVDTVSITYPLKTVEKVIFLNTGDIENGRFLHCNYSSVEGLPGQAKKSIQKGDILFSEIRPQNKRFAFVNFDADHHVVSTKLMVLRAKDKIDPLLPYFILTLEKNTDELQRIAELRSGTFPQITYKELEMLGCVLPNNIELLDVFVSSYLKPMYSRNFALTDQNEQLAQLRDTLLPKLISGELRLDEIPSP